MGREQIKQFRRRRDAMLLAMVLCIAVAGLFAAFSQTHKTNRPDWIGLAGTVVEKRWKFRDNVIYNGNVQAILAIETESGGRIETQVPMSLYQDARVGDWVVGSRETLKFYLRPQGRIR